MSPYNPDQPRAPKGSSNGGEWTDGKLRAAMRKGAGLPEEPPPLTHSERKLIERASEENSNTFSTADQARLDRIISKQPALLRDKVVYRGVSEEDTRWEGQKWSSPFFTSTTKERGVASRYNDRVIRITIPKGTRVLDYEDYGYWGNFEVLLGRGTRFLAESPTHWIVR